VLRIVQSKQDIRQLRKNILDDVKKVKGVSADDSKRFTKEVTPSLLWTKLLLCRYLTVCITWTAQVETTTEKHVDKISQVMTAKEKEINTV
jgi:ribosome recycling factor